VAYETVAAHLTPPRKLLVSEWAERYRYLPETSAEPGPWRNDRTPYLVGIMDAVLEPGVEMVVFQKPAQFGGSEALNNILGYFIHQDPSPILLVQIGEKEAKSYSKERIAPMIEATPVLKNRVARSRTRDSENTTLQKSFRGGHLAIAGANAPAGLRSRAIRILLCDEIDGYPPSAGQEGDPIELAEARTRTFWNRLKVYLSTPTLEGLSRIEAAIKDCDEVRRYFVPCPHCNHEQDLEFSQLIWDKDEEGKHLPETVQYACKGCGALIPEKRKNWMLANGRWRSGVVNPEDGSWHEQPRPARVKTLGFQANAIYSPWMKWREIVEGFLKSKGDPLRLQVWVNTVLGEVFKEQGFRLDAHPLLARCEVYPEEPVPEGVLLITAGVDIQADRIEVEVVGWGFGYESWSLNYLRLPGDPTLEGGVWQTLDHVLARSYKHPSGMLLKIYATGIDSGFLTQNVYKYCHTRRAANIWPVKGIAGEGKPIWDRPNIRNKYKVPMYPVGVDTAKTVVMSHLRIQRPDEWDGQPIPGFAHFPTRAPYDEEYFRQLTSEIVVVRRSPNGYFKRVWMRRPGRRAEALDNRVYALAAHEGAFLAGVRMETIKAAIEGKTAGGPKRRVRSKGVGVG
jgi:phage terminase large subunit GpA-like protein